MILQDGDQRVQGYLKDLMGGIGVCPPIYSLKPINEILSARKRLQV